MRSKVVKKKVARAKRKPKPLAKPRPTPRTKPKARAAAKTNPAVMRRPPIDREAIAALEAEVRRLRSTRRRLELRLTAAVQEIGMLRQFELRAQMFENELAKRDAELSRLRGELADRLGGASIVSAPS